MIEIESRVMSFLRRHCLIRSRETIVVGVSGGADSVCLLHMLAGWQKEFDINLHVAHLNHQLRGAESEGDAKYVADLGQRLDIPVTIGELDVAAYRSRRSCSIEEAARELRYDFLAEVAGDIGAQRVAIGHTKDDQVETVLMHILRGTGVSGLCGLEPLAPVPLGHSGLKAKNLGLVLIRPLLDVGSQETLSYCQERQLGPRFDSSNLALSLLRNRLRLELIPVLRKYNPSIDQALLRLARIAKEDCSFIEQQALQLWDELSRQERDTVYLDKKRVWSLPAALQSRLIRLAVGKLLGDTRDMGASHIEAVRSLLTKSAGRKVSLPHRLMCQSGYDEVAIASQFDIPCWTNGGGEWAVSPVLQGEFPLNVPGETSLPGWQVTASITLGEVGSLSSPGVLPCPRREWIEVKGKRRSNLAAELDLNKVGTELSVRQRKPGDRFQPLGMKTPKKLQDFMVDARIPASWRHHIPLVCSPRQIVWVVGWRIAEGVKVTEASKRVLRLEFVKVS